MVNEWKCEVELVEEWTEWVYVLLWAKLRDASEAEEGPEQKSVKRQSVRLSVSVAQ